MPVREARHGRTRHRTAARCPPCLIWAADPYAKERSAVAGLLTVPVKVLISILLCQVPYCVTGHTPAPFAGGRARLPAGRTSAR